MLKRRFLGLRGAASLRICYARRRGSTCGAVEGSAYARTQFVRNSRKGLLALSANEVRATLGSALAALHPPVCPHFEHYPTLRFNEPCFPDLEANVTNRTILTKNKFSEGVAPTALVQGEDPFYSAIGTNEVRTLVRGSSPNGSAA